MVVETEYYDLIDVKPNASEDEIKKAYLKKAQKIHPDKCPDRSEEGIKKATEAFQHLNNVKNILLDSNKREIYDRFGKSGLENNNSNGDDGGHPFANFHQFFGGQGFPFNMGGGQKPKPGPIRQHLKVSLAELYTGKNVKISLNQQVLCGKCNGKGTSNPDGYKRCNTCSGKGQVVHLRQIGPGMMQQIVQPCGNCSGKGKTIAKEDMCKQCDGKQVKVEEKEHFMNIKPGMDWGMGFHLEGKGHQQPDNDQQGDIEIQLAEISGYNPSNFRRQNNDLHMTHELSLVEALCGFNLMIYQLDERKIYINHTKQNKIIQPNEVMKITGEGMPLLDNPGKKGDLYIHFEIKLPKVLDEARKDVLLKVLPHSQQSKDEIKEFSRKVELEEVKNQPKNFNDQSQTYSHSQSQSHSQSNFNFEHEIPNPGVQCAQQ